jgi:hypothetical protein
MHDVTLRCKDVGLSSGNIYPRSLDGATEYENSLVPSVHIPYAVMRMQRHFISARKTSIS